MSVINMTGENHDVEALAIWLAAGAEKMDEGKDYQPHRTALRNICRAGMAEATDMYGEDDDEELEGMAPSIRSLLARFGAQMDKMEQDHAEEGK